MTKEKTEIQRSAESEAFNLAQREAGAWASSSLVPKAYQNNVPNVLIAMEMAKRIGASVMAVMQNLHIIHGKPAFGASFLIATVNGSGRFTPIRYRMEGTPGKDDWGCRAYATDRESGEECAGPAITVKMAKAEGWWSKKDRDGKECSKWQTMPELMLHYRAAAFWTRVYCPELSMGIHTTEEMEDVRDAQAASAQVIKTPDAPPLDPRAAGMDRIRIICAGMSGDQDEREWFQTLAAGLGLPTKIDDMDDDQFSTIVAELEDWWKQAENLPDMHPDPPRDLRVELFAIAERLWPGEAEQGVKHEADKMQCDVDKLTDSETIALIGLLSGQLKGGKA